MLNADEAKPIRANPLRRARGDDRRMKALGRFAAIAVASLCSSVLLSGPAGAFDLNGAWAGDRENCAKIFNRNGNKVTFSDNSDVYGGGFVVEGDYIAGKSGRCRIKARKDDGMNINLIAACSSDIMFENMQFSLKVVDANTVMRLFPGMEGMAINFARCPAQ
jgi:hypothetical protein